MSIDLILTKQNPDGGWPYVHGISWTEPTVYAVLALLASAETDAAARGMRWLKSAQLSDGGWPPETGIDESTWVTALVALLPPERLGGPAHSRGIAWLTGIAGRESSRSNRLRMWLLGVSPTKEQEFAGWPWFVGTAAWVGPTALAILALDKDYSQNRVPAIQTRIQDGRRYLLRRMCHGGGWNHGSVRALGYESGPYPETTGMALAALRGVQTSETEASIELALRFLGECRSADAWNWLRLGLMAHGRLPVGARPPAPLTCRTLPETCLDCLLSGPPQRSHDLFWS
jgi:hypothetical protein